MVRFDNILKRLFAFVTGIKFRIKNKFIYWFVYKKTMYALKNDYTSQSWNVYAFTNRVLSTISSIYANYTYIFVLHKNLHFYTCDDFFPQQILPDIDINLFFIDETTSYMNLPNNTTSKKYLITYSFLMTVILYRARL